MSTYYDCKEGHSQYEDIDLRENREVDARYIKPKIPGDKGNKCIEALPYPRDEDSVMSAYRKTIVGYDRNKILKKSKLDKMMWADELRIYRFPLPYYGELEDLFYRCMVNSYRSRRRMYGEPYTYTEINEEQQMDSILVGEARCSTASGFAMVGLSGSGKSTGIEILTDRYPQVIVHQSDNGHWKQIPYLVVNMPANSSFDGLYREIGKSIDRALGNIMPYYENIIRKATGRPNKLKEVERQIEMFSVGVLIIDEIQNMDFDSTREGSYDSLLTIANETKVGLVLVGTNEAKWKMTPELRTARRIGNVINSDKYCRNKEFFRLIVEDLFQYQCFKEIVPVTDELVDTLYEMTFGIIDQLVGLFICMEEEYVYRDSKDKINADFVRKVEKKYYPGMLDVLSATEVSEEEYDQITSAAVDLIKTQEDEVAQAGEAKLIMDKNTEAAKDRMRLDNVMATIQSMYPEYTEATIKNALDGVLKKKGADKDDDMKIAGKVISVLSGSVKHKTTSKKTTHSEEDMRAYLGLEKEG